MRVQDKDRFNFFLKRLLNSSHYCLQEKKKDGNARTCVGPAQQVFDHCINGAQRISGELSLGNHRQLEDCGCYHEQEERKEEVEEE